MRACFSRRNSALICSHMSELISSRTCRAFSRAAVTQAATESRFDRVEHQRVDRAPPGSSARLGRRPAGARRTDARNPSRRNRPAIEPEIEADVDQAGGVLRAFEVAADPIERVGDA